MKLVELCRLVNGYKVTTTHESRRLAEIYHRYVGGEMLSLTEVNMNNNMPDVGKQKPAGRNKSKKA